MTESQKAIELHSAAAKKGANLAGATTAELEEAAAAGEAPAVVQQAKEVYALYEARRRGGPMRRSPSTSRSRVESCSTSAFS